MKKLMLFFVVAVFLIVSIGGVLGYTSMRKLTHDIGENTDKLGTIKSTLDELQERVKELEERPAPTPVVGIASWYGNWEERAGNLTAAGDIFRKDGYTVAHRTLPFGTVLLIENTENGIAVPAIVNDRGPYIDGREIDLTEGLAKRLGFIRKGLVEVRYYTIYVPQDPLPYNKASAQ